MILNLALTFILGGFVGGFISSLTRKISQALLNDVEIYTILPELSKTGWKESFPFLSLWKRGRLGDKRKGLIEFATALTFTFALYFGGMQWTTLFVIIIDTIFICCFITDFEEGILPDQFTLSIIWLALLASLIPIILKPSEAILGASIGYLTMWFFNFIYRWLRKKEGMFPGDFKLNAAIGAFLGVEVFIKIMLMSFALLIISTLLLHFFKRRSHYLQQEAPYGCYASIVSIITSWTLIAT